MIEDAINTGQLNLSEAKFQAKKVFNEGEKGGALNNMNVIRPQKSLFDDLQMPLSEVLVVLPEGGTSSHLILLLFKIQSHQIGIEMTIVHSTKG